MPWPADQTTIVIIGDWDKIIMQLRVLAAAMLMGLAAPVALADERFDRILQKLAPPERLEQLCDYTAMQRIRQADKSLRPDRTVANAMAESVVIKNDTLEVKGGAFRSKHKWYALTYRCTATPDHTTVTAFDFKIGDEIPETKWAGYGLWQ